MSTPDDTDPPADMCGPADTDGEYGPALTEDYPDDSASNPLGDVTDDVYGGDEG